MTPRIAIIGGGSAHWTPRLLLDFVNTAPLAESEVVLMDTSPDSLPAVQAVADHVASLGAGGLDVTTTTDLDAALAGAQFVITAYSVGGFEAMIHDLTIPEAHGLPQPVGDSVGPGGIARALRSIPVTVGIARAMERKQERQQKELQYQTGPAQAEAPKPVRAGAKVGRNDPCPCGSGKKYKKCHGANA